jgi:hypothetical protein
MTPKGEKITQAQIRYIEILFQDLKYNYGQRKAKLGSDYAVYAIDELSKAEGSQLIRELRTAKGLED